MQHAQFRTTHHHRSLHSQTKKDGSQPNEHANPNRHGQRQPHPVAQLVHPGPAAPRCVAAWRQANSRTPDTLLPVHGGAFSNGDRRRSAGAHAH